MESDKICALYLISFSQHVFEIHTCKYQEFGPFKKVNSILSYGYTKTHSSVHKNLDYFQFELTINKAPITLLGRGQYSSLLDIYLEVAYMLSFPGGSDGKDSTCNAGDLSSIPGLGRSHGGGKGYSPQYSCLENSMDRGVWQATVLG